MHEALNILDRRVEDVSELLPFLFALQIRFASARCDYVQFSSDNSLNSLRNDSVQGKSYTRATFVSLMMREARVMKKLMETILWNTLLEGILKMRRILIAIRRHRRNEMKVKRSMRAWRSWEIRSG